MAATRIKTQAIHSVAEAVEIIDEIARREIAAQKLEIELKRKVQELQDRFGPQIAEIRDGIDGLMARVAPYIEDHGEAMFKPGLREGETALARFGLRLGNPTVGKLKGWTWEDVIAALRGDREWAYLVRVKEEVAKEMVKVKMTEEETLKRFGMKITQTESAWVTPKAEEAV